MSVDAKPEPGPLDPEVVLTVNYDASTIDVSDTTARISYSVKGDNGPEKPRQVKWVALNLQGRDQLLIRPKQGQSKKLFNPGEQGKYRLFWPRIAVTSGLPVDPFKDVGADEVEWRYEIEVQRRGEPLFGVDPVVLIEREG